MAKHRRVQRPQSRLQQPTTNPNYLLAKLPPDDYARVERSLAEVPLKVRQILHHSGDPIDYVYFPGNGFCSILTVLDDGHMVEVTTIGREGAVGVGALLGDMAGHSSSMVQAPTDLCYRMSAAAYRAEMGRRGAFYEILTRYTQAMIGVVMLSTGCNAVHSVEQRLARWLLLARDRVGSDEFPLTQEFLAMMLGVSRPTVTVVAGTLQKAGLITYRHGVMTILDGEALERASCECYRRATELLDGGPHHTSRRPSR